LGRQPVPARYGPGAQGCCEAFRYCLALAMVEAGKARLVGQEPGEPAPPKDGAGAMCIFETAAGERFSLPALAA
jgi:hypothetical protein